jgi:hypothetical protein
MRTRIALISVILAVALTAVVPAAHSGPRGRRVSAALIRVEASLQEISGHAQSKVLGAELELARRWLDDARSALQAGSDRRAEEIAKRLETQISLLRAMLATAEIEARAEAAEIEALALADRIRELEARYDAIVLEARGAELTSAFPEKKEAPIAP